MAAKKQVKKNISPLIEEAAAKIETIQQKIDYALKQDSMYEIKLILRQIKYIL